MEHRPILEETKSDFHNFVILENPWFLILAGIVVLGATAYFLYCKRKKQQRRI